MTRKEIIKIIPLILIAAAIALSPSLSLGEISKGRLVEIRAEDILISILGAVWIIELISRKGFKKAPLFFPIMVWLLAGAISVLTNWTFGGLEKSRGFFYFLKEVEFFLFYFYVFYHIKSLKSAKFLIKVWLVLGLANTANIIYETASGNYTGGHYGKRIGAIGEKGVFPVGGFFLLLFIFFFNIFIFYFLQLKISKVKKALLGVLSITPAFGVFGSGSDTVVLAGAIVFSLTAFLFLMKKKRNNLLRYSIVFLIIIFVAVWLLFLRHPLESDKMKGFYSPVRVMEAFQQKRMGVITWIFSKGVEEGGASLLFFGLGKGYLHEAHNQYLRNLVETGLLGSIAFLALIFLLMKKAIRGFLKSQDGFLIGLCGGLIAATVAMLFCSLATEPFIVVKVSEVYWFFAGLTMAGLSLKSAYDSKEIQQIP